LNNLKNCSARDGGTDESHAMAGCGDSSSKTERRSRKDRRSPALGGRRATDHGTRVAYQYDGWPLRALCASEAEYHARYAKGLIPGWVDASAARARLEQLHGLGVGARHVAMLCDLSVQTVRAIPGGARRVIHPRTAAAIMETRASLADGQLTSQAESYQTRERLRRLLEEDYPRECI